MTANETRLAIADVLGEARSLMRQSAARARRGTSRKAAIARLVSVEHPVPMALPTPARAPIQVPKAPTVVDLTGVQPFTERDLATATGVSLHSIAKDAEVLVTAFEAMEHDAATIACSMELEGIVDATTRVRGAYEGGRRNRSAGRIRWRVSIPAEHNNFAEIEGQLNDIAPPPVEAAPK